MEQNQGKSPFLPSPSFSINALIFLFIHNNSLIATIRLFRLDLMNDSMLLDEGQPIPKDMPPHFLDKHIPHVEGIGEPTIASFFTQSKIDPTNWFPLLSFSPPPSQ